MEWERVWPIILSTPGGVYMAVSLWALVTNRIALPREVLVWKDLYDKSEDRNAKLETMVEGLTKDLADQNRGHLETISLLKQFIPAAAGLTPKRRHDDAGV